MKAAKERLGEESCVQRAAWGGGRKYPQVEDYSSDYSKFNKMQSRTLSPIKRKMKLLCCLLNNEALGLGELL